MLPLPALLMIGWEMLARYQIYVRSSHQPPLLDAANFEKSSQIDAWGAGRTRYKLFQALLQACYHQEPYLKVSHGSPMTVPEYQLIPKVVTFQASASGMLPHPPQLRSCSRYSRKAWVEWPRFYSRTSSAPRLNPSVKCIDSRPMCLMIRQWCWTACPRRCRKRRGSCC